MRGRPRINVNLNPTTTTATPNLDDENRATEAVVSAVADAKGVSPLELRPLAEVIDPDALDALFAGSRDGSVVFTYHGFRVHVSGDNQVMVRNCKD